MSFERIERDCALICSAHPSLSTVIDRERHTAQLTGSLPVELPDGTMDHCQIVIDFGRGYPAQAPRVSDADGRWPADPDRHIVTGGAFCLFLPRVDAPTLKTDLQVLAFVDDIHVFLRQQIILDSQLRFDASARFPGPEWPHGPQQAFRRYCLRLLADQPESVREALWDTARGAIRPNACPCGSGKQKGECCGLVLKQLTRAIYESNLHEVKHAELLATPAHHR